MSNGSRRGAVPWLLAVSLGLLAGNGCSKPKAPLPAAPSASAGTLASAPPAPSAALSPASESAAPDASPPAVVQLAPAGQAAAWCRALTLTQRRIVAAAWSEALAPSALPEEPASDPSRETAAGAAGASSAADSGGASVGGTNGEGGAAAPDPEPDLAALDRVGDAPTLPSPFGECDGTRGGAWSMVLDPIQKTDEGLLGDWSLLHVDKRAHVVAVTPLDPSQYTSECGTPTCLGDEASGFLAIANNGVSSSMRTGVFDWDGDGEAELWVSIDFVAFMTARDRVRIWTFKNGAIQLYPRGRDLDVTDVKDFDGDGRPDLIVHVGGGSYSSPCSSRSGLLTDPLELLAHSLADGGFSLTDGVAVAYAKHECPPSDASISTQKGVLCARVWGQKPAAIAKSLAAGCKAAGPTCGTECEDQDTLRALLYQTPIPLKLPSP